MTTTTVAPMAMTALLRALYALALAMATCVALPTRAQTLTVYEEQGQLVRGSRNITAIGHDALGDRINPYTGSLEFVQTDFALPGNHSLPVGVGRRLKTGNTFWQGAHFADWELEIPHLKGTFSNAEGWTVDQWGANRTKRCSLFSEPGEAPTQTLGARVLAESFWKGNFLVVPGAGEQEMLLRAGTNQLQPADGRSYPVVTKAGWQFRCLASLANGQAGEGFVALSPDGTQYQFDWLVSRPTNSTTSGAGGGSGGLDLTAQLRPRPNLASAQRTGTRPPDAVGVGNFLARDEVLLLPTRVTDRLGNSVTYSYHPTRHWQLLAITASDGRAVSFAYDGTSQRITSATAAGRTWAYAYSGNPLVLTTVTQPDGRQWRFSGDSLQVNPSYTTPPAHCDSTGVFAAQPLTKTLMHPSGLSGSFTLTQTLHARSFVPPSCPTAEGANVNRYPVFFVNRSVSQKTLSGPGLAPLGWSFNYGPAAGGVLPCTGCSGTKTVLVIDARGHVTRHVYGNRWGQDEGQLQRMDEGWSSASGTALRSTTYRYRAANAGPYPSPPGISLVGRGDNDVEAQHRPQDQREISQGGHNFAWLASAFNVHAQATTVTRSSSLGFSRTETSVYLDHLSPWVIGQLQSRTESSTGLVLEHHTFHPATGLRASSHSHGLRTASYDYHPDGTLRTYTDQGGRNTVFSNYKRGLAQLIQYPDTTSESAVVDDWGLLTRHTNPAGAVHDYAYDPMGRLAQVRYPTGDATAYHPTTLAFEPVAYAEYGLPAGHWRQTVSTGNAITTRYFDALWRPRLTRTWDAGNPASTSQVVQYRWDADGRATFQSYAQRDIASVDTTVHGTGWAHDALGREFARYQDSELGLLTTTTRYLPGFLRQSTSPRGHISTTAFQAWDTPSEDSIRSIASPEGVNLVIVRDVFGKALSITRSGTGAGIGASATRSYVYDAHQRLCKTIEPESGATVQYHDSGGNVQWRASGLALPGTTTCDHASVPAARMISHGYDARNRLTSTAFGDGSPGIGRSYTADGLPLQLWSSGQTWGYAYNNRRLLTAESLTHPLIGATSTFSRSFDAHGHLASLRYPSGLLLQYAPNALGQPTQVSGYAHSVVHHPNGAVAAYTLSNGIAHTMGQNLRGLPQAWRDAGITHDTYAYDANANVLAITDVQQGLASRTLAYDGLDRLTSASGVWGAASYTYDALDNLRASAVGGRSLQHHVDAATNRLFALSGSQSIALAYDANGNLTQRGGQGFVFDIANRLQLATGKASYTYDAHGRRAQVAYADGTWKLQVYAQDGRLLLTRHSGQASTAHIHLGNRLIAEQADTGGMTFLHTDALGSPVARSNAWGSLLSRTHYEAYGATAAGAVPIGPGFTGHVNDADTGLVYMQQRYYDPLAGRFLSVDPVTTDAMTGNGFNRYVYGNNNPYRYVDPDGRQTNPVSGERRLIERDYRTNSSNPAVGKHGMTRTDPITGSPKFHDGADLKAPIGTPLLAPISGDVSTFASPGAAGNTVTITGTGNYAGVEIKLMHLSELPSTTGKISEGQVVATSGNTGNAKGFTASGQDHVHMQVKVNGPTVNGVASPSQSLNPASFLNQSREAY